METPEIFFRIVIGNIILSKREIECIYYLKHHHMTAKEIACKLGISYRTVQDHIQKLKEKLQCKDWREAIRKVSKSNFPFDALSKFLD